MSSRDNLIPLDLSKFSRADIAKIEGIGEKLRLMRRWFRFEIDEGEGRAEARIYSGDRGPERYAHCRIVRSRDGSYELYTAESETALAQSRAMDAVIDAIPDEFFYTSYRRKG